MYAILIGRMAIHSAIISRWTHAMCSYEWKYFPSIPDAIVRVSTKHPLPESRGSCGHEPRRLYRAPLSFPFLTTFLPDLRYPISKTNIMDEFIRITTMSDGKSLKVLIRKDLIVSIAEAVDGTTLVNLSINEYKEMQSFFHAAETFEALAAQLL